MFEFKVKSGSNEDVRTWHHEQQLLPQACSSSAQLQDGPIDMNSAPQSPPSTAAVSTPAKPPFTNVHKQSSRTLTPSPSPSPSPPAGVSKLKRSVPKVVFNDEAAKKAKTDSLEESQVDPVKAMRKAETAVKTMISSLSQTTRASAEIQNNSKRLSNWMWLAGLPQFTEFEHALKALEEHKQSSPMTQHLLVNKCDLGS